MNRILTIYLFNKKQNSCLILMGILSLTLMLLRVKITHDIYLLFLIWNLFLGYIPYALSSKIKTAVPGTFIFYALFFGWIIFLPNAFYLLTDFIHLHHSSDLQYLFDALLLTSFTIAGFYAGIVSLFHIHRILEMKYETKKCFLIIFAICYLTSFGIYLGRILRFNSWDILSHPIELFYNILKNIFNSDVYEFTILLGSFIFLIYSISFSLLNKKPIKSW
ncbi:MAG TPA: DUF1361 domain-containing protein [Flavobacterium sp.]|uniref:DUF1361 domain-containing protein n=1 Tax=Flavobacterium sp. TaxID=239 RepID=UPI002B96465E|nr:DUF1361 domain-containing protein [Flavobacterium sp.]HNP32707.1 DUF1361 domain-containing protein [Flavobacterium sp.]